MNHFNLALTAALVSAALPALAADFKPVDGVTASVSGTATLATMIRMEDPSASDYALIPSTKVAGATPGQLIGQTGGADLNFANHHAVSTVLKAVVDLDVHGQNLGLFVRGSAWHDFVLGHDDAAYGNYPNGYKTGTPLSDAGFTPEAKFSNAMLRDAFVYGRFENAETQLKGEARLGRQVLNWGVSQFFNGGIGMATNPYDLASQMRPGALPQESRLPLGMFSVKLDLGKAWGLDAFVPYESRASSLPGCGTFFDTASISQPGCNLAGAVGAPIAGTPLNTMNSLTEQVVLTSGFYVHRSADVLPSGIDGQFGLSLRYLAAGLGTEFKGYLSRTTHPLPNIYRVTVENVNGGTLPAGLAGGLARLTNPNGLRYSLVYPEGVRMAGLSFDTRLDAGLRVFGEMAYRANQPLAMGGTDLLTASLLRAPTSLLALNRNYLATPAGAAFDGDDRHPVTTANLGFNKVFAKVLGAERIVVAAEAGYSHVGELPPTTQMRYGRGLAFGAAPYLVKGTLTPCAETAPGLNGVPGKTCTSDGFVSETAWGLRGRVAATYASAWLGAALTPSLTVAKDIQGYSYDGTFSEGRLMARMGLRADWGKAYYGEIAYTHFGGGKYNLLADRSNLALAAGLNF
ncbi:MAG: DUF1302 family protein [Paucibacter sp.]|nr:DUF1302 family protein [Roseateles sp.]